MFLEGKSMLYNHSEIKNKYKSTYFKLEKP